MGACLCHGVVQDLVAKRGEGSWVWTSDGKKLLDMTSGAVRSTPWHCAEHVSISA